MSQNSSIDEQYRELWAREKKKRRGRNIVVFLVVTLIILSYYIVFPLLFSHQFLKSAAPVIGEVAPLFKKAEEKAVSGESFFRNFVFSDDQLGYRFISDLTNEKRELSVSRIDGKLVVEVPSADAGFAKQLLPTRMGVTIQDIRLDTDQGVKEYKISSESSHNFDLETHNKSSNMDGASAVN